MSYIYKTGDLARWLVDGNIEFLGRIDHQVKISGFRIEPGEIEYQLLKHEKIKEAIVIVREGKGGNKYLCAYWAPVLPADENSSQLKVSDLKEFLSGKLASYMIPSYFVQLEKIPINANGKINRKLLPEPTISNINPDSIYVEPGDELEKLIARTWKEVLDLDRVGTRDNFFDLGGNSLKIIRLNNKLSEALGLKIPVVNLFKYPTISSFKSYLQQDKTGPPLNKKFCRGPGGGFSKEPPGRRRPDTAVIGMSGRFPGSADIHRFWENLKNSKESISFFTIQELKEAGVSNQLLSAPNYVKARGTIEDKDRFDAAFFNYTPQEAMVMDPQMRMFHECVWEALEDAGYNPETYEKPIGLYIGAAINVGWKIRANLFAHGEVINSLEVYQLTDSQFIPTRISYKLNLKGPSMFMQTACSTSLLAIHTTCNALRLGDCAMGLAGGVNLLPEKKSGYLYQEGMVLSPDGHCRAFDAKAKGTVGGEGAAVVLLKPLDQALEDRDHIYAVIKASAANNDGSRKVGFSAPSIDGQAEAIASVYDKAGIPTESIAYIETHGTGTTLGDPIEIEALKQAFKTQKKGFCALGSVKSSLGHMDSASGAVGFIKAVLALKHKQLPPTLYFEAPNPQIDLIESPFYVNTKLAAWERGQNPRRAGVSSFGIGGTNVHVVLEEQPPEVDNEGTRGLAPLFNENESRDYQLILLSAKTQTALDRMTKNLANYLKKNPKITFADAAYTLQLGRKAFSHRWMTVCSSLDELTEALASPGLVGTHICSPEEENPLPLKVEKPSDQSTLTEIGRLWLYGQEIDWKDFYSQEKRHRVPLPGYPFEGQRYWLDQDPFEIENLPKVSRGVPGIRKEDIADWFYLPRWTGSTLIQPRQDPGKSLCFLVFITNSPLVRRLVERLRSPGTEHSHIVITVEEGDTFKKPGNHEFFIHPRGKDHYQRLLTELSRREIFPDRVLHFWNVTGNDHHLQAGVVGPGFYSLLYLAQAIAKQEFGGEIRLDFVTTGIQEVTGHETLEPGKGVVSGPLKVIPQEYPYILCRCIDIELPPAGSPQEEILAGCLINEFLLDLDSPDIEIAYRRHYRWTKAYEPVRLEPPGPGPLKLRERGVYLVTGGWGNIGLTLAEYLVKQVQARLILTGVSSLPARGQWDQWLRTHDNCDVPDPISLKIKKIRQLEAAGGEVLALTADAGDKNVMQKVIREAEKTFGPINGIIHAAGAVKVKSLACPLEEIGEEECEQQFRPKIQGTLVLKELFAGKALDFCLLTSSLSPVLGGLGFTAYSAANAFMDVFAHQLNRMGTTRWISIGWADWGFKQDREEYSHLSPGAAALEMIITPDQGVETFKRILTLVPSPVSHVIVSAGDLQARIDRWVKPGSLRKNDSPGPGKTAGKLSLQSRTRPNLSSSYTPPHTSIEKSIANIWEQQFGIAKIGIKDDFFELGGDSLKAIAMISRIHQELNARVRLNEFFTRPTIETLSEYITSSEKGGYVSMVPVEKKEYYALSSTQKRLYVLSQMENVGIGYNLPMAVMLEGSPDRERLEKAFAGLVKRHESFRTSIEIAAGQPVQKIHDDVKFEMEYYQVELKVKVEEVRSSLFEGTRGLAPLSIEPAAGTIKNFIRPFDLSQAPLLRVGLMPLHTPPSGHPSQEGKEPKHILMIDMHHIVSDGISHQILAKDFTDLYENRALPRLYLQYKDYSEWQNSPRQQELIKKQETYWLKELDTSSGDLPILNLPTDYPRPLPQCFEGSVLESELTAAETKGLKEIARAQGATLFMVLMAVTNIFLSRLASQEDILLGTPSAGRRHADQRQIIGMFVNTLVMRSYPLASQTFQQLLGQVKERTLEAFENQDYPFENLVEKVTINRDLSRNPLFDVMFVLQSQASTELPMPGPKPLTLEKTTSQFDLIIEAIEQGETLFFSVQYCGKLFRKDTIARFIEYFKKVISSIIEKPAITLAEIDIISSKEKKQILVDFNDTFALYPKDKTIHELFENQVNITPHHIVLVEEKLFEGTRGLAPLHITYRELNQKSDRLAHVLIEKGIQPDSIAAIMTKRSVELIIGIFAILKAGGAYLPIDPDYPEERIRYMLSDSSADVLVTSSSLFEDRMIESWDGELVFLSTAINNSPLERGGPKGRGVSSLAARNSQLAYIIYTSGSTGVPKGTMVEHQSLVNLCYWHNSYFSITAKDIATQYAGIGFDASIWELFPYLITGVAVHIISDEIRLDIKRLCRYYQENNITISFLPTQFCQQFMEEERDISTLRILLTGGDQLNRFTPGSYRLYNNYAPTENTVVTTVFPVEANHHSIPIGKPISNVQIYILNKENLELQPLGVPGELCIAGDNLSRGYLNNPELTAEKFCLRRPGGRFLKKLPPWTPRKNFSLKVPGTKIHMSYVSHMSHIYRSGDLARWLLDGNIEFLGRIDHQVKIRGFRIELGEIENKLQSHHSVKEAIVMARQYESSEKYLCAYIVTQPHFTGKAEQELKEYLSRSLPSYMIPSAFVIIEQIPLTPAGKIDRKALPKPELRGSEEYEAPRSQIEEQLVRIYQELLETGNIGIQADFFALGGSSLKVLQLVAQIHKAFAIDIPPARVFKTPRIKDLAASLVQSRFITNKEETVILLNSTKAKKVFAFPSMPGYGFIYMELARLLPDYAFYAFNYIEKEAKNKMDIYVEAIREIQQQGPYILLGYSAGAKLCVKAAELLEKAGQVVSDIIILDGYSQWKGLSAQEIEIQAAEFYQSIEKIVEDLGIQHLKQKISNTLKSYRHYHDNLELEEKVEAAIHLIRAEDKKDKERFVGWQEFTRDQEMIYEGYGNHHQMLSPGFIERNAVIIAKIFRERRK
jgi:surfactin family lipopeptide synthetase A